jgi:hypothetical protein
MSTATGAASLPSEQFTALVGLLNQECTLVERLVFKLTEAELLASAGEARFMALMVDEVEAVAGDLGSIELARGILVADLAHELGLESDDTPLAELISYAGSDTAGPLEELKERLQALTAQLEAVTQRGSDVVASQLVDVQATLERVEPTAPGRNAYDRWGAGVAGAVQPTRFDHPA